jgi:hypothetical protein
LAALPQTHSPLAVLTALDISTSAIASAPLLHFRWGNLNEPPEHLKTKKQLGELGLSPLKPSGVIETQKYGVFLYDSSTPECCRPKRKPILKQLETLAANDSKLQ